MLCLHASVMYCRVSRAKHRCKDVIPRLDKRTGRSCAGGEAGSSHVTCRTGAHAMNPQRLLDSRSASSSAPSRSNSAHDATTRAPYHTPQLLNNRVRPIGTSVNSCNLRSRDDQVRAPHALAVLCFAPATAPGAQAFAGASVQPSRLCGAAEARLRCAALRPFTLVTPPAAGLSWLVRR